MHDEQTKLVAALTPPFSTHESILLSAFFQQTLQSCSLVRSKQFLPRVGPPSRNSPLAQSRVDATLNDVRAHLERSQPAYSGRSRTNTPARLRATSQAADCHGYVVLCSLQPDPRGIVIHTADIDSPIILAKCETTCAGSKFCCQIYVPWKATRESADWLNTKSVPAQTLNVNWHHLQDTPLSCCLCFTFTILQLSQQACSNAIPSEPISRMHIFPKVHRSTISIWRPMKGQARGALKHGNK